MKYAFLDFSGRLARLPYLGYSALLWGLVFAASLFGFLMIASGSDASVLIGGLIVLAAILFGLAASVALVVKRLHDVGLAGIHGVWIYLLDLLGVALQTDPPNPLGVLVHVLSIGVGLWLLFAPGESRPNAYGATPE